MNNFLRKKKLEKARKKRVDESWNHEWIIGRKMLPPPRKWKKKKLWHRGRRFCRRERQFPFRIQTMTDASFPWRSVYLAEGFHSVCSHLLVAWIDVTKTGIPRCTRMRIERKANVVRAYTRIDQVCCIRETLPLVPKTWLMLSNE